MIEEIVSAVAVLCEKLIELPGDIIIVIGNIAELCNLRRPPVLWIEKLPVLREV